MKLTSTYKIRIHTQFTELSDTLRMYRNAVDYYIRVIDSEWGILNTCSGGQNAITPVEAMSVATKRHPNPKYRFDQAFYKFPSYLRRAAICDAYGLVSSYRSNLDNWYKQPKNGRGNKPQIPVAGYAFPVLYRENCFIRTDRTTADIKVYIRNTWDWITVRLRNTDVRYIERHCSNMRECSPSLVKKGKVWSLHFPFERSVELKKIKDIKKQRILAVDLGITNSCTCCIMDSEGTVSERKFLKLSEENDSLEKAMIHIGHVQRAGWRKMPSLWVKARGINEDIARKTARFIADVAKNNDVDCVVMEQLHLNGRKRGNKKWKLHMWKSKKVQAMVTHKCHGMGIRVAFVYAGYSSQYAFDGSGLVLRGKKSTKVSGNYSMCEFSTGKVYNCDLNASYNIGARYFIRGILGGMSETQRADCVAKVPNVGKRSTCTLSGLKDLRAVINGSVRLCTERITSEPTRESDVPQGQPYVTHGYFGIRKHSTLVV